MTRTCSCGKPTAGAWLCDDCQKTLAYAIANVAAYYDDLETVETKRARYSSQAPAKGSVGKAQPCVVDMRFANTSAQVVFRERDRRGEFLAPGRATLSPGTQLKYDAWATVVAWCRVLMEEAGQVAGPVCEGPCLHPTCAETRRRRWPGNTIRSMCLYLDRMYAWVHASEWCPAMLDEFLDLERRLCRMVNRPPDRWYAGICSAADENGMCTAELYATANRGHLDCPGCGARHDVGARRDFLLAEASDHLVTATEAAGALIAWTDYDGSSEKLVDRIRKWRDRERLEVRDVTSLQGRDRHLYRLGDIQDLLVRDAQRKAERMTA